MALQPIYEQIKVKNGLPQIKMQSTVECKPNGITGGNVSVLALNARVIPISHEVANGEVRYSGKVIFSALIDDDSLRFIECGVEFLGKAENGEISAGLECEINYFVLEKTAKWVNGQLTFFGIISAEINLSKCESKRYLVGGSDFIAKNQENSCAVSAGIARENFIVNDEFSYMGQIDNVLFINGNATVTSCQCGINCIIVDGEISLSFVALTNGQEKVNITRQIPFRQEMAVESVMPSLKASASVQVKDIKLNINVPSEDKSVILLDIELEGKGECFEDITISQVEDAYSLTTELNLTYESVDFCVFKGYKSSLEKVSGQAIYEGQTENQILQAVACENLAITSAVSKNGGIMVEGVVSGVALIKDEERLSSVEIALPFSLEMNFPEALYGDKVKISGIVKSIGAKNRVSGEIEMIAEIILYAEIYENKKALFITDVEEGEVKYVKENAISIYVPEENEDIWSVCKTLGVCLEDVYDLNPELKFPLTGEERILVYRQNKVDY